jgi:ADP-ribose pyrophosphatase YjhB (NUDIX family)
MTKELRNKATTVVYLFLRKEGKILIGRRCNTKYQDGYYQVPAGHVIAGELPTQTVIREAKEEIGVVIKKENLKLVHTSFREKHDDTGDRIDLFFESYLWEGEIRNAEQNKCDDLRWIDTSDLPSNLIPHIRIAAESLLRNRPFSELNVSFLRSTGMYPIQD